MTTENVAILFTDVVGSTELSQRLSPEAADEVRRGHFSILRQAIAEAGGTEVKNLGDGLMVASPRPRLPWPAPWPCNRAWSATTGYGSTRSVCGSG